VSKVARLVLHPLHRSAHLSDRVVVVVVVVVNNFQPRTVDQEPGTRHGWMIKLVK
jgi:hypothetical protein